MNRVDMRPQEVERLEPLDDVLMIIRESFQGLPKEFRSDKYINNYSYMSRHEDLQRISFVGRRDGVVVNYRKAKTPDIASYRLIFADSGDVRLRHELYGPDADQNCLPHYVGLITVRNCTEAPIKAADEIRWVGNQVVRLATNGWPKASEPLYPSSFSCRIL